jgi:acyl-CoA hydrolase
VTRLGCWTSIEALEFSKLIHVDDLVVWGQAASEPLALTKALMQQRATIGRFRAFVGMSWSSSVDRAHLDCASFTSYCGTANNRVLGHELSILPVHYSHLAPTLARSNPVLLLQLAPGEDEEHFSFGAAQEYLVDLLPHARLIVAEVNRQAPRTFGGSIISRDQLDLLLWTDYPLVEGTQSRLNEVDAVIASHVAGLIHDGATLQIGLGSIPSAVLKALSSHRDLGIHSGLIGDEVVDLADTGVINNDRKRRDRGLTITGLLAGSQRLIKWADHNTQLGLRPTSYTHAHEILAAIDCFTSINSAVEVDLTGQINAEVARGRYVGAVGGAVNFLRGARASRGGLPIIALPSTAGDRSRIVARLSGPVSTARSDAGIFVTEYGVADVRDLNERQRCDKLLAIAHPMHQTNIARTEERMMR